MMQAIKASLKKPEDWYLLTGTLDDTDTNFCFDRFRITGDTSEIEVAMIHETADDYTMNVSTNGVRLSAYTVRQRQPFHAGGGWTTATYEHDFSFNLTTIPTGSKILVIKGLKPENLCYQLYTFATGFGSTRGKTVEIGSWDFNILNIGQGGGDIGRMRLDNLTNFAQYNLFYGALDASVPEVPIAITALQTETAINTGQTDLIKSFALANTNNGTFSYVGTPVASECQAEYDALISRGWTLNGPAPA